MIAAQVTTCSNVNYESTLAIYFLLLNLSSMPVIASGWLGEYGGDEGS